MRLCTIRARAQENDSFIPYIHRGCLSQPVMSQNEGSHSSADFVGILFNLIMLLLFGGSLVAAWLLS